MLICFQNLTFCIYGPGKNILQCLLKLGEFVFYRLKPNKSTLVYNYP